MSTDALVLLKADHKEVQRLFRQYRAETGTATRAALADEIVRALTVHSYLEDEVLYPKIRAAVPDLAFEMDLAHQEHHVAEVLCAEIDAMSDDDPELPAKMAVLTDVVTRHIHTEEQDWFPKVRDAMGRKELQQIGEHLLALRQTAPTSPHRPGLIQRVADAMSA
ncbi:hemerythrin domain-containing protein [Streptacidiphilus melanogenes]|uniref:hemerythrin domain-containing protein n=1 Tax=Streptacidiphilus melanogenes TaxID=411235 RepID=UPI0005A9AB85|nr:hemerythrin domain-containing protein [Streptacidiphilus melanogenes]